VTRRFSVLGAGCVAGLCLGAAGLGLAQQASSPEEGGPVLTFGLSSTLSATDNYNLSPTNEESAELLDTRLSFGYRNRRPNDLLSFNMSGVLHAEEPPGNSRTLDDRSARLGYERQGVNSALSFGADYSLSSVDALDPFDEDRFFEDDPLEESDLTQDRGDREQIGARFSFSTGLTDPLSFALDGRYRERIFSGTSDPDLFDTQLFNLSATTRVTLSPVSEARVVLRYEDYAAEDAPQTDRQTSSLNFGLTQALSTADATTFIASRIGTPDRCAIEKLRANRASVARSRMSPTTGKPSLRRSQASAPSSVRNHCRKAIHPSRTSPRTNHQ